MTITCNYFEPYILVPEFLPLPTVVFGRLIVTSVMF